MRSASSTCAGKPDAMRPATYFTSGEYATTRSSRARASPVVLYRRHRSRSSMALTLVSMPCSGSGPWVALRVGGPQPRGLYPSVDLRRGDRGVAQQLLDRPEVGAAVEQVGGERVAQ